ncbi:MAG TPA: hypothetical protein VGC10_05160 [Sphingomonas sp.]
MIDNPKLSAAERHELISAAIMPIADHTTRSILYIDEELGAQGMKAVPRIEATLAALARLGHVSVEQDGHRLRRVA